MGLTELLMVIAVLGGIVAVLYPTLRGASADANRADLELVSDPDVQPIVEELEERRRTILGALAELAADREAGNIGEADYAEMRRRYEREAVEVLRTMESRSGPARVTAERSATTAGSGQQPERRLPAAVGWGAAIVAFAALAGAVLSSALRPRGADDVITGGLPRSAPAADQQNGRALVPVDSERMAELERRVGADSSDVPALVELGHLYLATQRFDGAARLSMKALSQDPENPEAITHLGMVLVAANHPDEAEQAFTRALEIDPDFAEALLYRGIVAFQGRDFPAAIESWERYLDVAPPEADVDRVRAMLEGARQAAGRERGS